MGEAALRREFESRQVEFDFLAPKMAFNPVDRKNLSTQNPEDVIAQATKITIRYVVTVMYPQGMTLAEGDHWEVLQEAINSDETCATVSMGEIAWLIRTIEKEGLKFEIAYTQWIFALLRYLKLLKDQAGGNEKLGTENVSKT